MARRVSFKPRNRIAFLECSDCGNLLRGKPRVILVDVLGTEEAQRENGGKKVKSRRWFCNYYCANAFLTRITVRKVLPPQ